MKSSEIATHKFNPDNRSDFNSEFVDTSDGRTEFRDPELNAAGLGNFVVPGYEAEMIEELNKRMRKPLSGVALSGTVRLG